MSISISGSAEEPSASVSEIPLRKIEVEELSVEVPSLLVDCFDYILAHGLVEGIFRVSGSVKRMRDVTSNYPAYKGWLENNSPSPHDVSGVVKKFTRDYLHSIGGLFPSTVLSSLRALFAKQPRKNSVLSTESYRSASTSYSSGLESVCEENEDGDFETPRTAGEKLDSLAAILVSKNSVRKNGVFIYYLSVLKCVSAHQEQTRMPNANLAIVFQQYLFETWVVADLQLYQTLLEFLLDHFELFLAKYSSTLSLLGGIEEFDPTVEHTTMTPMFCDSISTSPLTEYSSHQASPPKFSISGSLEGRRRSSLTQKLGSFWDTYSAPANRRMSFISRGSGRSSERLPLDHQDFHTQESHRGQFVPNLSTSREDLLESDQDHCIPRADTEARQFAEGPSIWTQASGRPSVSTRSENKRKSFMGFSHFRQDTPEPKVLADSPSEPPMLNISDTKHSLPDTSVLEQNQNSSATISKRQSVSRRFSMWFKRNQ